jgi:hypothetical protein
MLRIIPIEALRIAKDSGRFFEGNAVFPQVAKGFAGVPGEHINVYTMSKEGCQPDVSWVRYNKGRSQLVWTF